MGDKKIYIVAKIFDQQGCIAYRCKTLNEARCVPGTLEALRAMEFKLLFWTLLKFILSTHPIPTLRTWKNSSIRSHKWTESHPCSESIEKAERTAIKIVLFLRISCYTANRELAVRGRYSGKAKRDSRTGYPALWSAEDPAVWLTGEGNRDSKEWYWPLHHCVDQW